MSSVVAAMHAPFHAREEKDEGITGICATLRLPPAHVNGRLQQVGHLRDRH